MIVRLLAESLRRADVDTDPGQLLDMLWLAALSPDAGSRHGGRPTERPGPAVVEEVEHRQPVVDRTGTNDPALDQPQPGERAGQSARERAHPVWRPGVTRLRPGTPTSPALPDPLGVGRAMRPLRIRKPAAWITELDEEATAELSARTGTDVWAPVLRAPLSRWPDLEVVIDCHPAMWANRVRRLELVFQRLGAFRRLRTWRLTASGADREPRIAPGVVAERGRSRKAVTQFTESSPRRLVLVVTDGTSPQWRGSYREVVRTWARSNPVGVVSLVEPRLWPAEGLSASYGTLRVEHELCPNVGWKANHPSTVPVPVADLHPSRLAKLVSVMVGEQPATRLLLLDTVTTSPPVPEPERVRPVSAVYRARSEVQPRAFELATALSEVPFLLGPLLDKARSLALPAAAQDDLAELLGCVLFDPVLDDLRRLIGYRFRDPLVRHELAARTNLARRRSVWWDVYLYGQDCLGLESTVLRELMEKPDMEVRLRRVAAHLPLPGGEAMDVPVADYRGLVPGAVDAKHLIVTAAVEVQSMACVQELARRRTALVRQVTPADVVAGRLSTADERHVLMFTTANELLDGTNPRNHKVVRWLVETMLRDDGPAVLVCTTPGRATALLSTYPALARLAVPVVALPRGPAEDAWELVRGLARRDGVVWTPEAERILWHLLRSRFPDEHARHAPLQVFDQAKAMYQAVVSTSRTRNGPGVRTPVEPTDIESVLAKGAFP